MHRYKKLGWNTFIIGLGSMGSKFMIFLLVPFYTFYLSPAEYGQADVIMMTVSILIPIVTLSIADGVFRYTMEKASKKQVFSSGCAILLIAGLVLLLLTPLLKNIPLIQNYYWLFLLLLLVQLWNTLFQQQVRADGKLILYSVSGLLMSLLLLIANVVFLKYLDLGVAGYLYANLLAFGFNTVLLFLGAKLYRLFSFRAINKKLLKKMLIYSLPLIPNAVLWWVMQVSDRYILTFFLGVAANGLYTVAAKIPSLLSMLNTVFFQAWSITAIGDKIKSNDGFFAGVFTIFSSLFFITTGIILLIVQPMSSVLFSSAFQNVWQFVPFLLIAVTLSSFSSFLEVSYMAEKKTKQLVLTTLKGGVINISLSFLLIPFIGIIGASIATLVGFLVTWLLRMKQTHFFKQIEFKSLFWLSFLLLFLQSVYVSVCDLPNWWIQGMFALGLLVCQGLVIRKKLAIRRATQLAE
ncbi:polysaccharide biosynthesis protein [Listeria weihenstephanensis FSL R9-0317]|uniref:Oligosaccharide flippase family protein n=1 Tax=Listeria weihenstephanensis TaxID=1006155 RepID=A0A841Z5T9_9LIST|nr:oligosaccharide flippase family protein [Listeria weihenstephanensis]EUJ38278.1 polysaccharide biosynthesis protein [Listeria weihenstephanensis FSL R9-0317]MBC1501321.1 oligosaccharide flippase family protein [Listeria weihenstephanensis]